MPIRLGGALAHRDWFILMQCYVDVHSTAHPDGALRGLIHAEIAVEPVDWDAAKRVYR